MLKHRKGPASAWDKGELQPIPEALHSAWNAYFKAREWFDTTRLEEREGRGNLERGRTTEWDMEQAREASHQAFQDYLRALANLRQAHKDYKAAMRRCINNRLL